MLKPELNIPRVYQCLLPSLPPSLPEVGSSAPINARSLETISIHTVGEPKNARWIMSPSDLYTLELRNFSREVCARGVLGGRFSELVVLHRRCLFLRLGCHDVALFWNCGDGKLAILALRGVGEAQLLVLFLDFCLLCLGRL